MGGAGCSVDRWRAWLSNLRVEFHDDDGRIRLVVREGPHPPGTADLGHQAWEMLPKLESLLGGYVGAHR